MSTADAGTAPARDPGGQGERTSLAWTRTALVIAVNALLAIRTGWVDGQVALTVVGLILLLSAAATTVYGQLRGRALAGDNPDHHEPPAAPARAISLLAVLTLVACAAGILSVLVEH